MRSISVLIARARREINEQGVMDADTAAQLMELGCNARAIETQIISEQG